MAEEAKIKAHEWKSNKRVIITDPINEKKENERKFLRNEIMKVAAEYKKEKCDKKGKPIESNIDKETENTIKKLKQRVLKENLAVYQTDKTAKFRK